MRTVPKTKNEVKMMTEMLKEYGLLIDGEFIGSTSGKTIPVVNPATGEVLAKVACATQSDVDQAVASAGCRWISVFSNTVILPVQSWCTKTLARRTRAAGSR